MDRQIEELLQKKKDMQEMLLKIGSREMELQIISKSFLWYLDLSITEEQLDNKLSGVMEESARFENNLRHIKGISIFENLMDEIGEVEKPANGSPKNGSVVPLIPTSSIAQALSSVVILEPSMPQVDFLSVHILTCSGSFGS